MKKSIILIGVVIMACMSSCKYDDDYLNPRLDKTIAYFASFQDHTRTVVVGEGLRFKIGAAMAGVLTNTRNETVDYEILTEPFLLSDGRTLLPTDYYNYSELGTPIRSIIPAGKYIGYFPIELDSLKFLGDPLALAGKYTIPVKIIDTSLDSIGIDSIMVSVKYMSGTDGYYLYESTIKQEINGVIDESKTIKEKYKNEADENTWRMSTIAPFGVKVTAATSSTTNGLNFNLTVKGQTVTYESIGAVEVTPQGENSYDSKTRDFVLNFKYRKDANTVYHVSTRLIFRNRVRDNVNETRDYLSYFNQ